MRLIKAKEDKQFQLSGVKVEAQIVNDNIEAITITDSGGKFIRIVVGETYSKSLYVLVEEPVEYKTIYEVKVKRQDGGIIFYEFEDKKEVEYQERYADGEVSWTEKKVPIEKGIGNKVINDEENMSF